MTNKVDFSIKVEEHAKANDLLLIESCFVVADEMEIDESDIQSYIHTVLKEKIRQEAIDNRTLRVEQDTTLDFLYNQ